MVDSKGNNSRSVLLGIDLGGTKLKGTRFSLNGIKESDYETNSGAYNNPNDFLSLLLSAVSKLSNGCQVAGVGIGVAGAIDSTTGTILNSPNIPSLNGFEMKKHVAAALGGIPVSLINDANAAALGEFYAGAGTGAQSLYLLTLGTGIGGGFVIDGEIWAGTGGVAGEVGHMCVQANGPSCSCGGRGCLEACVSGWAIVRDAKAIAKEKTGSAIASLPSLTPHALSELAQKGDLDANNLWSRAGTFLGIGIANLMNIINPELIVLTGGLAKAGGLLLEPARRTWEKQAFDRAHQTTSVRFGLLGEWAGVRGAIQPLMNL